MKKLALVSLFFGLSQVAMALPVSTDQLVQGLLTDNQEFSDLLKSKVSANPHDFKNSFSGLHIERAELTQELRRDCDQWSKSGSALEVSFTYASGKVENYYFSTAHSPEALELCKE